MSVSKSHEAAKSKAAGKSGRKEVPLRSGRRLEAETTKRATGIGRSGNVTALVKAAGRLKESHKAQNTLQIPGKNFSKGVSSHEEGRHFWKREEHGWVKTGLGRVAQFGY